MSEEEFAQIKAYCINPVDSRETDETKPDTLIMEYDDPADVAVFSGFKDMPEEELKALYDSLGLAMTFKDFQHIQNYYCGEEKEIRTDDGDSRSGYLLVRPLPSHHVLYRVKRDYF